MATSCRVSLGVHYIYWLSDLTMPSNKQKSEEAASTDSRKLQRIYEMGLRLPALRVSLQSNSCC
eukprot:6010926-Amphidinium_carterae.1